MSEMQSGPGRPAVGRVVHYTSRGSADGVFAPLCRAAIVTDVGVWMGIAVTDPVDDPTDGSQTRTVLQRYDPIACALTVENPSGTFKDLAVPFHPGDPADDALGARCASGDRAYPGGTWHWPERT